MGVPNEINDDKFEPMPSNTAPENSMEDQDGSNAHTIPKICIDSPKVNTRSKDPNSEWEELRSKLCQCEPSSKSSPPCYYCSSNTFNSMSSFSFPTLSSNSQSYNNFRRPSCPNLTKKPNESLIPGLTNPGFVSDVPLASSLVEQRLSVTSVDDHGPVDRNRELPENMTPVVSAFCEYRLHKMALTIPASVISAIAIAGTEASITTLFNLTLALGLLVFYPVFGALGLAFSKLLPHLKSMKGKCSSKSNGQNDLANRAPTNIFSERRPSFQSYSSRLSSMGNLPSIAEEQSSDDGISLYDELQCQMCLHERFLGVCTHHHDSRSLRSNRSSLDHIEIVISPDK